MNATGVGLRSERGMILIALMLATALGALDATIIATAVPSIVSSIGGFAEFPWLFSIYLLAQSVSAPVYGRLADLYGRKPILLLGFSLFLLGSILCGLAWNMAILIGFRVIQGLGAGAVGPVTMTVVGDLYSLAERAKVQGYLSSVWALCSVAGPTLGGLFSQYASWRWIFFVNIPIGLLAGTILVRHLHETVERRRRHIDYWGASLLTAGSSMLILAVLEGGQSWPWLSPLGVAVPAGGVVILIGFVLVERRSPEPILPLWVFSRRLFLSAGLASAAVGAILLGLTSYVPTYVESVLGTGPLVAGLAVGVLTIGWPISAAQSGRIYLRIGFRNCALIGCAISLVGCALLSLLGASSSFAETASICFVIGVGLGLIATPALVSTQSAVGWSDRGVVTATSLFCRSTGSAVGVAIFGAIANATLGSKTIATHPGAAGRASLALAVHHVFLGVIVVAAGLLLAVLCMPRRSAKIDPTAVMIDPDESVQPPTGGAALA